MTSKVNIQEEIQKLVDYASENMGNDVLLAQTTDDLLTLITNLRRQDLEEVKKEIEKIQLLLSFHSEPREENAICIVCLKVKAIDDILAYLDSKIRELGK